jgi:predicted MFS family arabinose efflux permease
VIGDGSVLDMLRGLQVGGFAGVGSTAIKGLQQTAHLAAAAQLAQGLGAAGGGVVYEAFGPAALPIASVFVLLLATLVFLLSARAGRPLALKTLKGR